MIDGSLMKVSPLRKYQLLFVSSLGSTNPKLSMSDLFLSLLLPKEVGRNQHPLIQYGQGGVFIEKNMSLKRSSGF